MQITFEIDLDYGEEGPDEGEPTPTVTDIENALNRGLTALGFTSVDVIAKRL